MSSINKISNFNNLDYSNYQNKNVQTTGQDQKKSDSTEDIMQMKRLGIVECQTCANRLYVDGSDDPGVSFKSPTHIPPEQSAAKVSAHESEHYTRERQKADSEDRKVLSNSIRLFTSTCQECGKTYVSGGLTTTITKAKEEEKEPASSIEELLLNIANQAYGRNYDSKY